MPVASPSLPPRPPPSWAPGLHCSPPFSRCLSHTHSPACTTSTVGSHAVGSKPSPCWALGVQAHPAPLWPGLLTSAGWSPPYPCWVASDKGWMGHLGIWGTAWAPRCIAISWLRTHSSPNTHGLSCGATSAADCVGCWQPPPAPAAISRRSAGHTPRATQPARGPCGTVASRPGRAARWGGGRGQPGAAESAAPSVPVCPCPSQEGCW